MILGYARVSTDKQELDLQIDALEKAGCERIYKDEGISGGVADRPALNEILRAAREGDTIVVWKLDRLGRNLEHLIELVNKFNSLGIGLHSCREKIDTTTPGGKLVFHIFGALAEFEKELIRERVNAGLAAARARGRYGGRPDKLTKRQVEMMIEAYENTNTGVAELCETYGISRSTFHRYHREYRAKSQIK